MDETLCSIGEGIQIRGKLTGTGELVVHGRIEGEVSLTNRLTVEASGMVMANVEATSIALNGTMHGNIDGAELVSVSENATMQGDIRAQEVEIADGAHFLGRLEMDVPLPPGL